MASPSEVSEAPKNALEFHSSASAEAFIHSVPALSKAAAFSWWSGSKNCWYVMVNRGEHSFQFVSQEEDGFYVGRVRLKESSHLSTVPVNTPKFAEQGSSSMPDNRIKEAVDALLGCPVTERRHRIDYRKTKAPNFTAARRPNNQMRRGATAKKT